jgi:hypothetical protein
MISAKYDGVENVMSAAWVGLAGERKVVAYIGTQGDGVVFIRRIGIAAPASVEDGCHLADYGDLHDEIFYQPGFDLPLVAGCAGWLVCKVMPYPDIQQQHNLFISGASA